MDSDVYCLEHVVSLNWTISECGFKLKKKVLYKFYPSVALSHVTGDIMCLTLSMVTCVETTWTSLTGVQRGRYGSHLAIRPPWLMPTHSFTSSTTALLITRWRHSLTVLQKNSHVRVFNLILPCKRHHCF